MEARGSRRRLRVLARGSVTDTCRATLRASNQYETLDSCGRPSFFTVASTPSEFPLINANSLSSKTWRPITREYDSTIGDMSGLTGIDGTSLEGVSATTLWTLHNRGTEAKRSDGEIGRESCRERVCQYGEN